MEYDIVLVGVLVLLGTVLTMSVIILIKPGFLAPEPGTPVKSVKQHRGAWWGLVLAGVYGGFVQAGVGFILQAALDGGLRYDRVRANALKMVCSFAVTSISLAIFIWFDLVEWIPGLVLAVGTMTGSYFSVRFAIRVSQNNIKWFLFVMTLVSCVAALFFYTCSRILLNITEIAAPPNRWLCSTVILPP